MIFNLPLALSSHLKVFNTKYVRLPPPFSAVAPPSIGRAVKQTQAVEEWLPVGVRGQVKVCLSDSVGGVTGYKLPHACLH